MTAREWLLSARLRLTASGSPDPGPDAEWLLMHVLGAERAALRARALDELPAEALERAERLLHERETGEPLQYVLGETWFYGRRFRCDRRALIPRQDTETLCEAALMRISHAPGTKVLDLCTGTGTIAITIALERPRADVTGTDLSPDALALAAENADELGARVAWREGDLWDALPGGRFDCIVANPPYLSAQDMLALQREVRCEPAMALFGGADGLDFYRRIAAGLAEHLLPGGSALVEIGWNQASAVTGMIREGLPDCEAGVLQDLNGLDRVVWARRR